MYHIYIYIYVYRVPIVVSIEHTSCRHEVQATVVQFNVGVQLICHTTVMLPLLAGIHCCTTCKQYFFFSSSFSSSRIVCVFVYSRRPVVAHLSDFGQPSNNEYSLHGKWAVFVDASFTALSFAQCGVQWTRWNTGPYSNHWKQSSTRKCWWDAALGLDWDNYQGCFRQLP